MVISSSGSTSSRSGSKLKEAAIAATIGDSKTVYKLVKTLSGKASQKLPLNGTDGKPLKSQEEEAKQ